MKRRQLILFALAIAALAPAAALAQTGFTPLVPVPATGPFSTLYSPQSGNLSQFLNALFLMAISLGGMAAVLQLVRAGYEYMGSDMWHKKEHAKILLGDTILGLLLLLSAYLILDQINPCILNLNIVQDISATGTTCNT